MNTRLSFIVILCLIYHAPSLAQGIAVAYREKDHWGYADTLGNIIVKPIYDDVRKASTLTSALLVSKDKKWGVISTNGKVVVSMKHSRILDHQEGYFITEFIEAGGKYMYGLYDGNT